MIPLQPRSGFCRIKMNNCSKNCIQLSIFCILLLINGLSFAQKAQISGYIQTNEKEKIEYGIVFLKETTFQTRTDETGFFTLKNIPFGSYTLMAFSAGKKTFEQLLIVNQEKVEIGTITLKDLENELEAITIQAERERTFGITQMQSVENFGIYEGRKTEVIVLKDMTANLATNNPRQVYARITGLNIWESDQAGLQLGIGGRGLSPNRTANFNVRQNGYDISADALGYPESYYTPPVEALERIEIVRGAASLQYGTQFGGLLNFKFKEGEKDKKISLTSRQSVGSWGFFGSFNSISGTVGKLNYYTYYQFKRGDGYRPNSGFNYHNFYTSLNYQFTKKLSVNLELTKMHYLAQQPGGLTDRHFLENPRQSVRSRNWFGVDWNLAALNLTYKINENTKINGRNFGLLAARQSLGNLERINVADFGRERTLIDGQFQNIGSEWRLLHSYQFLGQKNTFLVGTRLYRGNTTARQGWGSAGSDANFRFLNPNNIEDSDYQFPNENYAAFAENIFQITPRLSITPGVRWEYIRTFANGYYKRYVTDAAGNIIVSNKMTENTNRQRSLVLFGLGTAYELTNKVKLYANISQNYRAINFTDLRINNPNIRVDANIQDERGYTADLGIRGSQEDFFTYEVTLFYLNYFGKIGQVLRTDPVLFNDYRFRTNVADARNMGLEAFGELAILKALKLQQTNWKWSVFANFSVIDARYIRTEDRSIRNRKVEMVPPVTLKLGNTLRYKNWSSTLQYAYTAEHFSDATNARRTATAIEGIIPSYQVVDFSVAYRWRFLTVEATVNNLLNEAYFTRRADAYPGPGIIPADGRGFYLTLQGRF